MAACPDNIPCDLSFQRAICNESTGQWRCQAVPNKNPDDNGPPVDPCPPDPPCAQGYRKYLVGDHYECHPCGRGPGTGPPAEDSQGCPPGYHRGGGHPGNPCRPNPGGSPGGGGGTPPSSSQRARFYTPNWMDYIWSGQVESGVPQPTGSLLDLLAGNLFQQSAGLYGILPTQLWQERNQVPYWQRVRERGRLGEMPEERSIGVLGLNNGGAALGYIDPSWRFDTVTRPGTPPPGGGGGTPPPGGGGGAPPGGGNPCGGLQGCPPGSHRAGCHPGNECKPDNATSNFIGNPTISTGFGGLNAGRNNPASLLNPGKPLYTSSFLGGR